MQEPTSRQNRTAAAGAATVVGTGVGLHSGMQKRKTVLTKAVKKTTGVRGFIKGPKAASAELKTATKVANKIPVKRAAVGAAVGAGLAVRWQLNHPNPNARSSSSRKYTQG